MCYDPLRFIPCSYDLFLLGYDFRNRFCGAILVQWALVSCEFEVLFPETSASSRKQVLQIVLALDEGVDVPSNYAENFAFARLTVAILAQGNKSDLQE